MKPKMYKISFWLLTLATLASCGTTQEYNSMKASNVLLGQCQAGNTQACALVMGGGVSHGNTTYVAGQ